MSRAKKDDAGEVAASNAEAERDDQEEQEEEEEGADETSDEDEASDEDDSDEAEEPAAAAPAAARRAEVREPMRFSATTLVAVAALVGAGAFAAGRSTGGSDAPSERSAQAAPSEPQKPSPMGMGMGGGGGGGAPAMGGGNPSEGLPPGHPPAGDMPPTGMGMGGPGAGGDVAPASISWKAPDRWVQVPNPSTMRLATYRIPKAAGDAEDPELTITQAGGTVEANAQRWIGQFGPEGAKNAKRSNRTVAGLEVAIVEVEGKYANGMGKDGREEEQWAMLGAIVQTPGMPHFFKLTGPAKSVKAARAEFDAFVGSVKTR